MAKNLFMPLAGSVVLNRSEYSIEIADDIPKDFLGIGTNNMWHGAPDYYLTLTVISQTPNQLWSKAN